MLDTRFFRTPLTRTDKRGAKGKERYLPSQADHQDMLGPAQWQWLESKLAEPADLRIIASSVQVLPTRHGWESWSRLPKSRARLLKLLAGSGANTIVLVSGDRHNAFLYRTKIENTTLLEITASAINQSFRRRGGKNTKETDSLQTAPGYSGANYGSVDVDWISRQVSLQIHGKSGQVIHSLADSF